jgi:hypothetical protein
MIPKSCRPFGQDHATTIQSEAISLWETFRPIRAVAAGCALRLIARQEIFGDADTIAHAYNPFN